jgi:hypothetical protein
VNEIVVYAPRKEKCREQEADKSTT